MRVFRALKYLFISTAIVVALSYITNKSIDNIVKVSIPKPVNIEIIFKDHKKFGNENLENSVNEGVKKYSVLMPCSLNAGDSSQFINVLINGLDLKLNDTLNIVVFGNSSYNSPAKEFRVKNDIAKKFDFLYKELSKYSTNFNLNVSQRIIDYNRLGHTERLRLLEILLGQYSNSDFIYTIGHGVTTSDGFITFGANLYVGDREDYYFNWGEYFKLRKWLDVSCGSTSPVDPFSHEGKNPFDKDGLIRIFPELHLYIKHGFKIKQLMLQDYLNPKSKN